MGLRLTILEVVPWVCDGKKSVGESTGWTKRRKFGHSVNQARSTVCDLGFLGFKRRKEDDGERRISAGPWQKVIRPAHEGLKRNCPSSGVREGNDVPCKPTAQG